jgi:hypothetical protein
MSEDFKLLQSNDANWLSSILLPSTYPEPVFKANGCVLALLHPSCLVSNFSMLQNLELFYKIEYALCLRIDFNI